MSEVAFQVLVRLDSRARESLQSQLCAGLRRAIRDGVLRPGTRLPSSRALAADLRISRTTAVLAFDQLAAEGIVETRAGSGTFVARDPPGERERPMPHDVRVPHPPLSRRGAALATTPRASTKVEGAPPPFRLGTPALDRVPLAAWTRLAARRLRSLTMGQLDYGDPGGWMPLRQVIAEHVRRVRGATCTPEQVIVVSGAQHGLELVCRVLLDPGDAAWLEEPGYTGARAALIGAGARIASIPVTDEGIDVRAGSRRAPKARLAYVTPSHQFPLGLAMSLPRRLELLSWARRAGAWIVEDDYDCSFHYGSRPMPCLQGLDPDGRVIYVGSFSKSLFPAMRLGYLIVPGDLASAFVGAHRASDIHTPLLEQAVLADFMADGSFERHLRRMRGEYRRRLAALTDAVRRHGSGLLTLRPVTTGLHAVADLHAGVDDEAVCREARARGVEVMPLSFYAFDRSRKAVRGLVLGFAAVPGHLFGPAMVKLADSIRAVAQQECGVQTGAAMKIAATTSSRRGG